MVTVSPYYTQASALRDALVETERMVSDAQKILTAYLSPSGGKGEAEALNELLYLFDCPRQRIVKAASDAAIKGFGGVK